MSKLKLLLSALILAGLIHSAPASASDCAGSWQVLPNYNPGSGGACQALGLDSHQGTCQPGQQYETLCDDTSGGRYRICSGPTPCYRQHQPFRPFEQSSSNCNGPWSTVPGYFGGQGSPCREIGLNPNRGTCEPGYPVETLCDEASDGRYRTCEGSRRCR